MKLTTNLTLFGSLLALSIALLVNAAPIPPFAEADDALVVADNPLEAAAIREATEPEGSDQEFPLNFEDSDSHSDLPALDPRAAVRSALAQSADELAGNGEGPAARAATPLADESEDENENEKITEEELAAAEAEIAADDAADAPKTRASSDSPTEEFTEEEIADAKAEIEADLEENLPKSRSLSVEDSSPLEREETPDQEVAAPTALAADGGKLPRAPSVPVQEEALEKLATIDEQTAIENVEAAQVPQTRASSDSENGEPTAEEAEKENNLAYVLSAQAEDSSHLESEQVKAIEVAAQAQASLEAQKDDKLPALMPDARDSETEQQAENASSQQSDSAPTEVKIMPEDGFAAQTVITDDQAEA